MNKTAIFLVAAIFLAGCVRAPSSTAIPTLTPTLSPTPTLTPTPSTTPTATPDPNDSIDYFNRSTWTSEMSTIYNGLVGRTVAESGSALETQYNQENLTLHNGLARGMLNYLEGKSIKTYSNWNNTNFSDYYQFVNLYLDFRAQINSDPSAEKISFIDPWFDELILTNTNNYVYFYKGQDGSFHGGFGYNDQPIEENRMIQEYGSVEGYQNDNKTFFAKFSFEIPFYGKNIHLERGDNIDSLYGNIIDIINLPSYSGHEAVALRLTMIGEDGQTKLYTCAVNLNSIPTSSNMFIGDRNRKVITIAQLQKDQNLPIDEKFIILPTGDNYLGMPQRKDITINDLLSLLNRQVVLIPFPYIPQENGNSELKAQQIFLDGFESFSIIQDAGSAQTLPGQN